MEENQRREILQSDLDRSHDWSRFVFDTYFKFYAAYLALNIAALGFIGKFDNTDWVAVTFVVADVVGVGMAAVIIIWTGHIRRVMAELHQGLASPEEVLIRRVFVFPTLPAYFGLGASALTQFGFAIVWLAVALGALGKTSGMHPLV